MIHPNSHPTYNERQQKIIEMIDCNDIEYYINPFFKIVIVWINQNLVISYIYFEVYTKLVMSENEKTGIDNSTYDIMSALGRDADFLYDTIDKYIRDAESANKPELVELWKTIRERPP